jgi:hypothetical protein
MLENLSITDIQNKYKLGERNFAKLQLRRINLRGAFLKGINLEGSDLSYADLREADLSRANLCGCYLNETNLSGANLTNTNLKSAYLIKAYLTKANLSKAILQEAYLTGAFLTKANLMRADLTGTLLNGTQISGVYFKGAIYNNNTRFDRGFDPVKVGMEKISSLNVTAQRKITVANLTQNFENIISLTSHYLGVNLTIKYFNSSRPDKNWLQNFTIDKKGKIGFNGSLDHQVTSIQLKWFEKWENTFIKSCSFIMQDLPVLIEEKHLGINEIGEMSVA